MYFWRENRIQIDENHTFWNSGADHVKLDGKFVDLCLWTPNLQFRDLNAIENVRPSPSSSNSPPIQVILGLRGIIQVILRNVHLTVSCYMDFNGYPFDQQVRN